MTYTFLPLTEDPWQAFTLDLEINGEPFHAQVEIRYMPAVNRWFLSIWDHSSGEQLINQIPIVCSYGKINDLLVPYAYLRDGAGLGSLFCLRNTDSPSSADPAEGNLTEFQILWGDKFETFN